MHEEDTQELKVYRKCEGIKNRCFIDLWFMDTLQLSGARTYTILVHNVSLKDMICNNSA